MLSSLYYTVMFFVRDRVDAVKNERGATAVEYALLVALIAIVIIGVVATLGTRLSGLFSTVSSDV